MNQLAQRAFVRPVGIHRVEPGEPQPAQRTTAVFIQREAIQEGCTAGDAEKLGQQRLRIAKTLAAYRNARDPAQNFATDAALIGKNQGERQLSKAAKSHPRGAEQTIRRRQPVACGTEQATREDPPPLTPSVYNKA